MVAEGAGFEPAAQGLPVHGISSAAPSAARSPLRRNVDDRLTPVGGVGEERRSLPPTVINWRRGEDLNPRGTFWAPIRFRVGRLQPGSATPPRSLMRIYDMDSRSTGFSSCREVKFTSSSAASAGLGVPLTWPGGATSFSTESEGDPGSDGCTSRPSPAIASSRVSEGFTDRLRPW